MIGSAIHACLQFHFDELLAGNDPPSLDVLLDVFQEYWRNHGGQLLAGYNHTEQERLGVLHAALHRAYRSCWRSRLRQCRAGSGESGPRPACRQLAGNVARGQKSDAEILDALFLATLIRAPKDHEMENVKKLFERTPKRRAAVDELLWALVNTKEFIELHRMTDMTAEQLLQFGERVAKAMRKK